MDFIYGKAWLLDSGRAALGRQPCYVRVCTFNFPRLHSAPLASSGVLEKWQDFFFDAGLWPCS